MKILLLGGTGAMGVSLAKILLRDKENSVFITSRTERKANSTNEYYLQGNAHDELFLSSILDNKYDVIVDFMVYKTDEFLQRHRKLLEATEQYIFLSSSRVYASCDGLITEESPRLLDICEDKAYLDTDEYALAKARQENILFQSELKNWTIIRPYITYNYNRLQLGVYEKEIWLYRFLNGQSVLLPEQIMNATTTITYANDLTYVLSRIIGNTDAKGEVYHITCGTPIKWSEILDSYREVFNLKGMKLPTIQFTNNLDLIGRITGNPYQIKYDRIYDRQFDNSKVKRFIGNDYQFITPKAGCSKCLKEFLEKKISLLPSPNPQAFMDAYFNEKTKLSEYQSLKAKTKYFIKRYIGAHK